MSYAIACNVDIDDDGNERNHLFSNETRHLQYEANENANWNVFYSVRDDPKSLIRQFVYTLKKLVIIRRKKLLFQYADVIEHIEQWFKEKGLDICLRTTNRLSDFMI